MDTTTIFHFRSAIRQPQLLFKTLGDITPEFDTMTTTKFFAECRVRRGYGDYLLFAPIIIDSMPMAYRTMESLKDTDDTISDISILEGELIGSMSYSHDCSILIETIPDGTPLQEAIYTFTDKHLMKGLNALRTQLKHYNISLNNLSPENIIIGYDFEWLPIRCYMVTEGYGGDAMAFERIEQLIRECSLKDDDDESIVHIDRLLIHRTITEKKRTIYPLQDGCRRVVTKRGTGFIDDIDREIIPIMYKSASDFKEDRATVVTFDDRMGVIDRRGKYIIDPIYDYVEYNVDSGDMTVRNGDLWAVYDYLGVMIKDWHNREL